MTQLKFADRWQTSLGELFRLTQQNDDAALERLLVLLEGRDRDLETLLNSYDTINAWDSKVRFGGVTSTVTSSGFWQQGPAKQITVEYGWTITATPSGSISFVLPFTATLPKGSGTTGRPLGTAMFNVGGVRQLRAIYTLDGSIAYISQFGSVTTDSATSPVTWGVGDVGSAVITYRAV